jgi:hypothetical protein
MNKGETDISESSSETPSKEDCNSDGNLEGVEMHED